LQQVLGQEVRDDRVHARLVEGLSPVGDGHVEAVIDLLKF
jgi:hypothetical protein